MHLAALLLGLVAASSSGPAAGDPAAPRYGRDVRPVLSDRCFKCHGPDEGARQAGLRIDQREGVITARRDGSTPIVPGDAGASELWRRVTSSDPDERMPPPDSGKRALSDDELATLREWIEDGAAYEDHWAFSPPRRPALPAVGEGWARNAIDRFVLAELEANGIEPAPPASPQALFRRTFLALTGLSPTPEECDRFETSLARGESVHLALDRWITRLFSEEPYKSRYAEHMTRPWLDQARYADTCGIHMDAGRQAWLWRDWVLEAFRSNMPFDRFTVEQIAGDLLPDATIEQRVATGFHRNHVTTDEGGAIDAEYRLEYAVDRVNTTGAVFLGLTLGCARCHDHKYDPVTMTDYYSLIAFFDNNEEPGLYSQEPDPQRAMEPFLEVPRPEQRERLAALAADIDAAREGLETWTGEEERLWQEFRAGVAGLVQWRPSRVLDAVAESGATLGPRPDGSLVASGANPHDDVFTIRLRTDATDLSLLALEALPSELANGLIGRVAHGNAVLRALDVEAVSVADPSLRKELAWTWAWADYAQTDQDFGVTNLIHAERDGALGPPRWWALGGHERAGARRALFLADEPFGFPGGTELVVRLDSTSRWAQHALARPRLAVGALPAQSCARLPVAQGHLYQAGPFPFGPDAAPIYDAQLPPERAASLVRDADHARDAGDPGAGPWRWRFDPAFLDGRVFDVATSGRDANVLARPLFVPGARRVALSLGSDDGFVLSLDGQRVAENRADRSAAADQDRVTLELEPGRHILQLKVVNTGGPSAAYLELEEGAEVLAGELLTLAFPETPDTDPSVLRARDAWRRASSPRFAELEARVAELESERAALRRAVPRAMVMRERAEPRTTYVHLRGQYDHPDPSRPVGRAIPAALGALPADAPRDRLGLARWLVSDENPLTARVTVNRLWEQAFGRGIVATGEDFGFQGEWPSHPELLDWLAVELRESGWDVQHLLRLMLESATFRQSAAARTDVGANEAERLCAQGPRQRLSGEALRDNALYAAGLLVEELGGPSVKPYQPPGLWKEVAMLQSNTRIFERGSGEDLWRRSLYTYWKRAAPPPALMAFDAPTREFCVVRRATTDTPLQALVLWNDEQFVEAARALAERTLREVPAGDEARLVALFRRVLARVPEPGELELLADGLAELRARFDGREEDARALIDVGEAALASDAPPSELAAWTMVASAVLNLHETTNPR